MRVSRLAASGTKYSRYRKLSARIGSAAIGSTDCSSIAARSFRRAGTAQGSNTRFARTAISRRSFKHFPVNKKGR